jgi:hypothetical protein
VILAPQDTAIQEALDSYEKWISTNLTIMHASETDSVMTHLKVALTNDTDIAAVLGFKDVPSCTEDLEKAIASAGSAIAQERAHQLADTLGFFPSSSLMSASKEILKAWQMEYASLKRLVEVYHNLGKHLELHEKCLNDTPGQLYTQKDLVIKELWDASKMHAKTIRSLETLTIAIKGGDEDEMQEATSSIINRLGLLEVPQKDQPENLRRIIRSAYNSVTTATQTLAGEIQRHFPEVILFIGNGLPSELGSLWRPTQQLSLDSFDEIHQVVEAGMQARHNLWKVKCKTATQDSWFAIKEYGTGQRGSLCTCLKEAAIIYKYRHHTIVEIVALFQGDGGKKFFMQMPWYEKGSLDKWVCSDQQPAWPKVRSVLLDALIGVSHLHVHKIIHGDVKPANILVDSRERGRLSDFDISMDTQERTIGQKRTFEGHTTSTATMRVFIRRLQQPCVPTATMIPAKKWGDTEIAERGRSVLVMHARYRSAGLIPHQRGWTDAG